MDKYHGWQYVLVMSAAKGGKLTPPPDQPPPSSQNLRHPSPVCSTKKLALRTDMTIFAIPTPPASEQAVSPTGGGKQTCKYCKKKITKAEKITKAILERHEKYACSARVLKHRYKCGSCPKSYARPDALERHYNSQRGKDHRLLECDSILDLSSSPGAAYADSPIIPQVPCASSSLELSSNPILPVPAVVLPIFMGPFANYGRTQIPPSLDNTNHIPFINLPADSGLSPNLSRSTNHNFYLNQSGSSTSPVSPQYPPLPGVLPTSSRPSIATHPGRFPYSQSIDSASQIPFESVPPFRLGYRSDSVALASPSRGGQLYSPNHTIQELFLEGGQQTIYDMQYPKADYSQPQADEQTFLDLPLAHHDPIYGQPALGRPTHIPPGPGENYTNGSATNIPHLPDASGSAEFPTDPVAPGLELMELEALVDSWLNVPGEAQ